MTRKQPKKRKENPNSSEPNNQEPRKNQKKNSDNDCEIVKFSSYPSTIFKLDVQEFLNSTPARSGYDIFFHHTQMRDELIMNILKRNEAFLINNEDHQVFDGRNVLTHGKMNIKDNFQYKRNKCKIVAQVDTLEMYLCVNSLEFKSQGNESITYLDENIFISDKWLVYRCDVMKAKNKDYKVFQTKSTMMGNQSDTKSFHWLGIHQTGYCSIRQLESTVDEVRDEEKGKASEVGVLLCDVKEELRQGVIILSQTEAHLMDFGPVQQFELQTYCNQQLEIYEATLESQITTLQSVETDKVPQLPTDIPPLTSEVENQGYCDYRLPVQSLPNDMVWGKGEQSAFDLKQVPPKQNGFYNYSNNTKEIAAQESTYDSFDLEAYCSFHAAMSTK